MQSIMVRWLVRPWVAVVLILAAILGYTLSALLMTRVDAFARAGVAVDRWAAIRIARQHAALQVPDAASWQVLVYAEPDDALRRLLASHPGPEAKLVKQLRPPLLITVVLCDPGGSDTVTVSMSTSGEVIGFRSKLSATIVQSPPSGPGSRDLAEDAFRRRLGDAGARFKMQNKEVSTGNDTQVFSWLWRPASLPGLEVQAQVAVRGARVVSDTVEVGGDYGASDLGGSQIAAGILLWILALPMMVYGILRYVQRFREREVPHGRALIIGLFVLVTSLLSMLMTSDLFTPMLSQVLPDQAGLAQTSGAITLAMSLMSSLVAASFIGLLWVAFEGDVREAYPGRLTSFDALLSGRLLTRNVGMSVLVGALFAGLVLLLRTLVLTPWVGQSGAGGATLTNALELVGSRSPLVMVLIDPLFDSLSQCLLAVLVPLPLLLRWTRSPARAMGLCALSVTVVGSLLIGTGGLYTPWQAAMLVAAVLLSGLIVLFAVHDLLAALTSGYLSLLWITAWNLLLQPAPELSMAGLTAIVSSGLLVTLAGVLLWRGQPVSDEQVRPGYASNIAERLAMQAEVTLGQEARRRMLPAKAPAVAGVRVCFSPGSDTSGGYCDFFPLSGGRLALAVGQLAYERSAAALVMTLLKGYLRAYAQRFAAPDEVLTRLQRRLRSELGEQELPELLYAVYDPLRRTLIFSRFGEGARALALAGRLAVEHGGPGTAAEAEHQLSLQTGDSIVLCAVPPGGGEDPWQGVADAAFRLLGNREAVLDLPLTVLEIEEVADA